MFSDHPRVCGEHWSENWKWDIARGSSPRMRGAPFHGGSPYTYYRIIPAYAGSTLPVNIACMFCGDHPRVCGEHYHVSMWILALDGIIPAYAGSTAYWT